MNLKKFFGIEKSYQFEILDLLSLFTVLNVALVLAGWRFAPMFGLLNCTISMILNIKGRAHINAYIMQIALLVLNIYFLTL